MSNIPKARDHVDAAIALLQNYKRNEAIRELFRALSHMRREPYVQRPVRRRRSRYTPKLIKAVFELSRSGKYQLHEIANLTGLPSVGRVSEILSGKRKADGRLNNGQRH